MILFYLFSFRYSALTNEKKRRDLYFDYIHELEKKEREERRQKKNANIVQLKEILKTKNYSSRVKYEKIKEDLRDEKCWIVYFIYLFIYFYIGSRSRR